MANFRTASFVLLTVSVAACKIDSLPQRTSHDGATEAGKTGGVDSGAVPNSGEAGSFHLDSGGSVDGDLGYDAATDSPLDVPLVATDAGPASGPEAGPDAIANTEPKPESGPEPRPEPGFDSGIGAPTDAMFVVIDGGMDAGSDATPDVHPDLVITAIMSAGKTGAGGGTVVSSPSGIACGNFCSASFAVGTVVTLTPSADATSTFTGWSGSCSGSGSCVVTVDAAKSVTANFDVLQQGLNVAKTGAGGGLVTSLPVGISCGSTCLANFAMGTSVTLTATPDALSTFAGWSGACSGTGTTCTVTSDAAKSVTASFVKSAGTACAATGECQAGLTCLDSVCCMQSSCPQCHNCGSGGGCNIAIANTDDPTGLTCSGANSCDATGACKSKSGQTCSVAGDCASGSCTDSHCCTQSCGTCQACTGAGGTCVAVTSADDADTCTGNNTCDALGACKKKPGQTCGAATDCASGNCLDGVCCTQSSCPQCQNCGASGACSITVTSADDTTGATCGGANTCDASGACKKANGQTCSGGAECASGNCSGSVCAVKAPTWQWVTGPTLAATAVVSRCWAAPGSEVYLSAATMATGAIPETWLYHLKAGVWSVALDITDSAINLSPVFGTSASDVFAAVYKCPNGWGNCGAGEGMTMWHFDGLTGSQMTIPNLGQNWIGSIRGEANNLYASYGAGILRYDGTSWSVAASTGSVGFGPLAYLSRNEIYTLGCWGYQAWNGTAWTNYSGFDFCDVIGAFGFRTGDGSLQLWADGSNNFANGIRAWQFVESPKGSMAGSWGSKYGTYINDTSASGHGTGLDMWANGPNDFWVVGFVGNWGDPPDGRIWHWDGTTWTRQLASTTITAWAVSVWGTSPTDIWVALRDGRLLHYTN